ncbi:glycoside hydrolase family 6 protein [Actinoallomurus spadix]|uniref:Glucanase n=1 Tax=Actinoallomurus spadix TaxID=79912 RepID=A0ABN0XF91_9ACTN|nr:glycoside hydrolase family 6 protein [Actinoallomurus spadix]MCO5988914.1 glycoside hydrolase family 6 protein [Actinoallomurus spadix]
MRDLPWRAGRWKAAIATMAVACAAVTAGLVTGDAQAGTLSGSLYRDPSSQVVRWVQANSGDARTPVIRDKVASQPQARWLAAFDPGTVTSEVAGVVNAASSANQIPVLAVYEIPNRDCGGASAGGAPDYTQYQQWVSAFAQGMGGRTVIVILETDALALQTCLSGSEVGARDQAISQAVQTIKRADSNAKVYLDGGHSAWNSATEQGSRLKAAGVQYADGFFTNVSNFQPLSNEAAYGRSIISYLQSQGISGKHQIIDTSRNGGSVGAQGDWCGDDNTDHRIGAYPTLDTGDQNVDGYLWIKPPGEADGCAYPAGNFVPDLAYNLAKDAPNPPTSPGPTPTTTPTPPPGGRTCTATYQTTSSWQGGFQGQISVTAGSSAISGWKLTIPLPGGVSIGQLWNGTLTTSGSTATVTNVSWNGTLAAGATAQIGFTATGTASSLTPACTAS